tara:strand:+ start:109 stop:342 length:234 start_codon:yes stop_codon:yes gene_type:complete
MIGKKVLKWLKDMFKSVLESQVKRLQSDAFENKVADAVAIAVPDVPGFGDPEQRVLAKQIVDMVTDELAESLNMDAD